MNTQIRVRASRSLHTLSRLGAQRSPRRGSRPLARPARKSLLRSLLHLGLISLLGTASWSCEQSPSMVISTAGKGDQLTQWLPWSSPKMASAVVSEDEDTFLQISCDRHIHPDYLRLIVKDLAAYGEKRGGTPEGLAAAKYIELEMKAVGLTDVRLEGYHHPFHRVKSARFEVLGASDSWSPTFEAFEASGEGNIAQAPLVYVDDARDLESGELIGKVAVIERSTFFHRSAQYTALIHAGAQAMLYLSVAEDNLIQIGSVRRAWESQGEIPAITIGKEDGRRLLDLMKSDPALQVNLQVEVEIELATGQNVVGVIEGEDPHQIVFGGHYDTWGTGSIDNGGGVAAMLATARHWAALGTRPRYTMVFVAYDGEELALYGGYDFLRQHQGHPLVGVINFEMPSAKDAGIARVLASSDNLIIDRLVRAVGLGDIFNHYPVFVSLDFINDLLGMIATDIQGLYRAGFPTITTVVNTDHYHTVRDTPEMVDYNFLARSVELFDCLTEQLFSYPPAKILGDGDDHLWHAEVEWSYRRGEPVIIDSQILDAHGAPVKGAWVKATLFCEDFFQGRVLQTTTNSEGRAHFELTPEDPLPEPLTSCRRRYVQVESGRDYPLVEAVVRID